MIETDSQSESIDLERLYFNEANQTPLLTFDQEVSLSRAFHDGKYAQAKLKSLQESDEFDAKEATKLHSLVKIGQSAKRRLTEANMRLVISVARAYPSSAPSLTLLDRIQEGNIGLNRAIEKFDPERGFKFSTYATWWIRQAVSRAIMEHSRVIDLPVHLQGELGKIHRSARFHGLDVSNLENDQLKLISQEIGLPVERIKDDLIYAQPMMSLDQPTNHDDGEEQIFGDLIADQAPSPENQAINNLLGPKLQEAMNIANLSEREKKVLGFRNGLGDQTKPLTLSETAKMVGRERVGFHGEGHGEPITRERARQIEKEAMRKLRRHPEVRKILRGFLD